MNNQLPLKDKDEKGKEGKKILIELLLNLLLVLIVVFLSNLFKLEKFYYNQVIK